MWALSKTYKYMLTHQDNCRFVFKLLFRRTNFKIVHAFQLHEWFLAEQLWILMHRNNGSMFMDRSVSLMLLRVDFNTGFLNLNKYIHLKSRHSSTVGWPNITVALFVCLILNKLHFAYSYLTSKKLDKTF